jgi:hypothetical protein
MTVQPGRYVPLFPSETLLRGFDGQPPFLGCGIATDLVVSAWGTLGECQIQPNGRPFDTADFTNQLKVGWRAFERVRDTNGIPDRDDAQRIHRAMLPGIPDLIPLVSRDFDEVVEALRSDHAISIACRLSALPAGAEAARYTRADHQMPLVGIANGRTTVQDPMHPPSLRWPGHKVPLTQIEKAAKAIENGLVLAWKVPIGGWTQAALQTEGIRDRLRDERDRVAIASAKVEGQTERIARLQAALEACRDGQGNDCSGPIAAALETERIAIRELVDDRRTL